VLLTPIACTFLILPIIALDVKYYQLILVILQRSLSAF
jgi:hypothetical protein